MAFRASPVKQQADGSGSGCDGPNQPLTFEGSGKELEHPNLGFGRNGVSGVSDLIHEREDGQFQLATTSELVSKHPAETNEGGPDREGGGRRAFTDEEVRRVISPPLKDQGDIISVGMMASGLAWVQRQRERRRRQYLQLQAERQLRKIAEAESGSRNTGKGLRENPTFLQLASGSLSSMKSSNKIDEDPSDCSCLKVGSPELSKSGEGASARLDIFTIHDEDLVATPEVRIEQESGIEHAFILTPEQMHQVAIHVLPDAISDCRWKRLYGLGRDGDSFQGCLRIIHNIPRTLLVLRTTRGAVFGGYADSPWNSQDHGNARYFGSAQACLFSVISGTDTLKVYKWSGCNRYIQFCDVAHKMLAFGGGGEEGAFGLCVEEDFQVGSTGPCDTFGNDPLCDQENFQILDLEFWGFMTGVF